jgi:hypothetical protein
MLLTKEQTDFLLRTSWLGLLCMASAAYNEHYHLLPVPTGIFLSSIGYWGNPHSKIMQKIDMSCVATGFLYQWFSVSDADYAMWYYTLCMTAVACYPLSYYYYYRGYMWESTYSHAGIHIIGCIANLILYSGCTRECGLKSDEVVAAIEDSQL